MTDSRRGLPAVGRLLESPELAGLREHHPAERVRAALRQVIAEAREAGEPPSGGWADAVAGVLATAPSRDFVRVINATGVVLHTNLGRAPLAPEALEAIRRAGGWYGPLELDLLTGARGTRGQAVGRALAALAGAESALVVNNAAGALVLAGLALARAGDLILSRGEWVEIGGSFRIPDVLASAGLTIRAVGTTNRTRLADYEQAMERGAGAVLTVHRANFRLEGFVETPAPADIARAAHARDLPYVHDAGSGLLHDLSHLGLTGEPLVPALVGAGADVVIFSGDKLLGGPQAGCMVGRREAIERCARHPLARAFRADKLTLAALGATLALHETREMALAHVPVLRMLATPPGVLAARAAALRERMPASLVAELVPGRSAVGGGAFAGTELETTLVALRDRARGPEALAAALRSGPTPVLARIVDDAVCLDPRTLLPDDEAALLSVLGSVA